MSYLLNKTKEKVKKLEEELAKSPNEPTLTARLTAEKQRLNQYETLNGSSAFEAETDAIKDILSRTRDVEEKYKCRTVKFLFALSEWFEKPRSHKLASYFKNIAMNKINAPVCSIGKNKVDHSVHPLNVVNDGGKDYSEAFVKSKAKAMEEELKKLKTEFTLLSGK